MTFFLSLVPLKADMERNLYSSILRCDASNSSQYSMDPRQQRRDVCTVAAIWRNTLHPYCVESAVRHMTNDKSYCCPEQKQFITYSTYPFIGWGSIEEHYHCPSHQCMGRSKKYFKATTNVLKVNRQRWISWLQFFEWSPWGGRELAISITWDSCSWM